MINKEEIEKAKEYLKNYKYQNEVSDAIDIVLQYISELEANCYEQNNIINNYIEIEREHQKLNGKLQKKLTYYEDICKGKSIQELGMSNLYKED